MDVFLKQTLGCLDGVGGFLSATLSNSESILASIAGFKSWTKVRISNHNEEAHSGRKKQRSMQKVYIKLELRYKGWKRTQKQGGKKEEIITITITKIQYYLDPRIHEVCQEQ